MNTKNNLKNASIPLINKFHVKNNIQKIFLEHYTNSYNLSIFFHLYQTHKPLLS